MDAPGDARYARAPQVADVARICRALNAAGARYLLIGGFAVVAHGAARTTKDIDFLVDASPENVGRLKRALGELPDNAAAEIAPDDIETYGVVRVADEVVVDLLGQACGVKWDDAVRDAVTVDVDGVPVLVASAATLIRTKQTNRPSDAADCAFLSGRLDRG